MAAWYRPSMRPPIPREPVIVAVLADTDSRWKWGLATANSLQPADIRTYLRGGPGAPSARQLAEAGVAPGEVVEVSLAGFAAELTRHSCDVVVLALPGDAVQAVLQSFAAEWTSPRRPIVVTGYVGVVYERVVEGLYQRAGADIVVANSPADAETFSGLLDAIGYPADAVVTEPLPFLDAPAAPRGSALTFAAQPDVPSRRADRTYLVRRLAQYARRHPEREVLLKVRGLPGERLTHMEPYSYSRLVERLGTDVPANLRVVHGPMAETLDRTGLLVTVSSTAAVEAIHRGIPTAILTDFGVREDLGNHFFAGAGCYAGFDEIDEGLAPVADPSWAERHGLAGLPGGALAARVTELRGSDLPPVRPYFSRRRSPVYLDRLLRVHGLVSQPGRPGPHNVSRRLTRPLSRMLYRVGAGVIAPILRRLGEG